MGSEPTPRAIPLVCLAKQAMACTFEIQFPEGSLDRAVAMKAFDRIDAVESQLTIYRAESELSFINREARLRPIRVETDLFELLVLCHQLWSETGGAFDVTAGPLVAAWGFQRREGRIPEAEQLVDALERVGMQHVRLDSRQRTIQFLRTGVQINFGGIGKGYALDRLADWLAEQGCDRVLLGAGNSSIRALGSIPGGEGWTIDLSSPFERGASAVRLVLRDRALSTSGSSEQFFEHDGRRYSHILDPRTGWPARGVAQVSVLAPNAALAEALSTAVFVLGLSWAEQYCQRNSEIAVILFEEGRRTPTIFGRTDDNP